MSSFEIVGIYVEIERPYSILSYDMYRDELALFLTDIFNNYLLTFSVTWLSSGWPYLVLK